MEQYEIRREERGRCRGVRRSSASSCGQTLRAERSPAQGHFLLSSGLHSPAYVQCALLLEDPRERAQAGEELAAELPGAPRDRLGALAGAGRRDHRPRGRRGARRAVPLRRARGRRARAAARLRARAPGSGSSSSRTWSPPASRPSRPPRSPNRPERGSSRIGSIIDRSGGRARLPGPLLLALLTLDLPTWPADACPLCGKALPPSSRQPPRPCPARSRIGARELRGRRCAATRPRVRGRAAEPLT